MVSDNRGESKGVNAGSNPATSTKQINMQRIKFTSKTTAKTSEGLKYKGYAVGELPPTFGFIYNEEKEQAGISNWFNYKGLTWLIDKDHWAKSL